MYKGLKEETGSRRRIFVSMGIVLLLAVAVCFEAVITRARQNNEKQENIETSVNAGDALATLAVPELTPEKPEVDSSKEIVNEVLLSNVPKADFSFSFNGRLNDAAVVTRAGDEGRFNDGTYPEITEDVFPLFTEGVEGEALYLDGSYGVALSGVGALNGSYTISFWFRADELCDWSPFLMIGSHLLDVGGSQSYLSFNKKTSEEGETVVPVFNTIDAVLNNSCEIRPTMEQKRCINLNEWYYITICVDDAVSGLEEGRAMGYLYLNSELIGSGEVSKLNMDMADVKAYLGISCYDELFRASYDEVHIWAHVLDESQISSMYTAYIPRVEEEG